MAAAPVDPYLDDDYRNGKLAGERRFHNAHALHPETRQAWAGVLPPRLRGTVKIDEASKAETILDLIEANARKYPEKPAYQWLGSKGQIETTVTFAEAWRRIDAVAWHLHNEWGANRGDMVMLVYPPGIDFIFAHLGCLRAGCVSVPVYPPELVGSRAKKGVDKLRLIAENCGATLALTASMYNNARYLTTWNPLSTLSWPDLSWQATNTINFDRGIEASDCGPDDLAFLQYTSGSTGSPKGVMILHKNLLHNVAAIIRWIYPAAPAPSVITWLPQYHDMGLIGTYTAPLCAGMTVYCMSPLTFLADPSLWMLCAAKYKVHTTVAPNFAYGLIARKWKDSRVKSFGESAFDLNNLTQSHKVYTRLRHK
jgi:acyl-CoA synthetase (AMP-forming)/AMP-acid ligase II